MKKPKTYKPKRAKNVKKFTLEKKTTGRAKGYNRAWEKYSKEFLKNNPKCYTCGAPSKHSDHVYPHRGESKYFWNTYNVIALCISCHSSVTQRFDKKNPPDIEGKMEWVKMMRRLNNLQHKIKITPIRVKI